MNPAIVNSITGVVVLAALTLSHYGIIPVSVGDIIAGGGLYYLTGQTYTFAARSALRNFGIDVAASASLGVHTNGTPDAPTITRPSASSAGDSEPVAVRDV